MWAEHDRLEREKQAQAERERLEREKGAAAQAEHEQLEREKELAAQAEQERPALEFPTMVDTNSKYEYPLYVLTLGKAQEFEVLRHHLSQTPTVKRVFHEDSSHHAFGEIGGGLVNTIFIDPFSMWGGVDDATFFIFHVRLESPQIVFVLFVNPHELETRQSELFAELPDSLTRRESDFFAKERSRLSHYFRLGRNVSSPTFTKDLSNIISKCQQWHQTFVNSRPERSLFEYDVALSFAGEERQYAERIAEVLKAHGVRVFYDTFEQANLWGKNLYEHLHEVYSKKARFCIVLVSRSYAAKMWTVHERRAAQDRALQERDREYILPVRVDDTELPGLPRSIAYLSMSSGAPHICKLFIKKLGGVLGKLA